jgi:hypothetical protein
LEQLLDIGLSETGEIVIDSDRGCGGFVGLIAAMSGKESDVISIVILCCGVKHLIWWRAL